MDKEEELGIDRLFERLEIRHAASLFKKQVDENKRIAELLRVALLKQGPYIKERRDLFVLESLDLMCRDINLTCMENRDSVIRNAIELADGLINKMDN